MSKLHYNLQYAIFLRGQTFRQVGFAEFVHNPDAIIDFKTSTEIAHWPDKLDQWGDFELAEWVFVDSGHYKLLESRQCTKQTWKRLYSAHRKYIWKYQTPDCSRT